MSSAVAGRVSCLDRDLSVNRRLSGCDPGAKPLGRLCDEKTALTLHRMLHGPLVILVLVHSVPAVYFVLRR